MKPEIIIALDFPNREKALSFLDKFDGEKLYVKVGMELFYGEGPSIVKDIKSRGHKVFLDLKLHDIPNTVKSAMKVLASVGADMVNVHAAGGIKMMQAAVEGLEEGSEVGARPEIIAVTQLTSTDQETMNRELRIDGNLKDIVLAYARNAQAAGLDGVVCSAWESEEIHDGTSQKFLTVTPGIRLIGDAKGDQNRVTQLTSTDQETMNRELRIDGNLKDIVLAYARNAQAAGLDGVVCSAWESEEIHDGTSQKFLTVTPGIRLIGDAKGDQNRVTTPRRAKEMGSNYLVIGRSITKANDPVKAYKTCMEEINND